MRPIQVLALVLLACVAVLLVTPVEVSYATSGSMAPTIEAGDGYLVVPTDTIQSGDVITFYSPAQDTYVTHRVVRVIDGRYVTKGDANPSTDQAAGRPLVTRGNVVGEVLSLGGVPLTVPFVGPTVTTIRGHPLLALIPLIGALALSRVHRDRFRPSQPVPRAGTVLRTVLLATVVLSSVFVLASAQHDRLPYRATANPDGGPGSVDGADSRYAVPVDKSAIRTHEVQVNVVAFVHPQVIADGAHVLETKTISRTAVSRFGIAGLAERRTIAVTVRVPPSNTPGPAPAVLSVYPYPQLLPRDALAATHAIHPLVATMATVGMVYLPVWVVVWALVDPRRPLRITNPVLKRLVEP